MALLIGNLNYSHHPGLMAPTMDVHELANLLQQLGFRVVSLLDLTREEMLAAIDKFIQLLGKGVYGECNVVYFVSLLMIFNLDKEGQQNAHKGHTILEYPKFIFVRGGISIKLKKDFFESLMFQTKFL